MSGGAEEPEPAPDPGPNPGPNPGHWALFRGFARMGLSGFGGVLPFARQVLVEEERWLTDHDFAEYLGLGQVLPGPNIINIGVFVGMRFRGSTGAVVCVGGLVAPPVLILMVVALLYDAFGGLPLVRSAIAAVALGAAGLVVGMGAKMILRLKPAPRYAVLIACAFAAIGILGLPLVWVVLGLAPVGIALGWREHT